MLSDTIKQQTWKIYFSGFPANKWNSDKFLGIFEDDFDCRGSMSRLMELKVCKNPLQEGMEVKFSPKMD